MRTPAGAMFFLVLATAVSFSKGFQRLYSQDGNDVWAVGDSGNVFRSYDGGITWGTHPLGNGTLRSVVARNSYVWIVGDAGTFYRSSNNGETFALQNLAFGTNLRTLSFVSDSVGWIGGDFGTLLKTTDAGTTWTTLPAPTSQHLFCIHFTSVSAGWLAGGGGTIMQTINGGASWTSSSIPGLAKDLYSIDVNGTTLYVVGAEASAARSTNNGSSWTKLNFKIDSKSDINDVVSVTGTTAYFCGGGGFIRKTTDGAMTYTFQLNPMLADLYDLFFYDPNTGWACSRKNSAVLRTTDGGTTWSLPAGTTVSYAWTQKFSAGSIGNTFVIDPWNRDRIFVAMSNSIYMSADRGETWAQQSGKTAGGGSQHSFYISPKDSNIWLVASTGSPEGIKRSTDRGGSWASVIAANFSSYGMPLEMDPDHPDTVFYAPDGTSGANGIIYRSTNFGATWSLWSNTRFRSPCDIVVVPESTNIMYVGDGVTGSGNGVMWRSTNGGVTWDSIYNVSGSEVPTIGIGRLRNTDAYATAWSSGGIRKTGSLGAAWSQIMTTGSTWGVDVAKDDPNVIMYGVYGGSTSYLSTNAGASFVTTALTGSNSAVLCYDRGTFLVHQAGNGVWKYAISYSVPTNNTQALNLQSPNGGESWQGGTTYNITWSASNTPNVRLEYKTSGAGAWQTITAGTRATTGSYAWTCPFVSSAQVRVRISDASDGAPLDTSASFFTISSSAISSTPSSLNYGSVQVNTSAIDTMRIFNSGTATLLVSNVTNGLSNFVPSRTSFSIPAGGSDTLSVIFTPQLAQSYNDTLRITTNAALNPFNVPLSGKGTDQGLPIQLASFTGHFQNGIVSLDWVTLSEINNFGFEIQTSPQDSLHYATIPNSFVAGHGTTNTPHTYQFTVSSPVQSAFYRLKQIDLNGSVWLSEGILVTTLTGVAEGMIPTAFHLGQSYPNPFNPVTTIGYDVPVEAHVTVEVFNMLGEKVGSLVNEPKSPGRYAVSFNADRLPSGLYFYRMQAGSFTAVRRMVLIK